MDGRDLDVPGLMFPRWGSQTKQSMMVRTLWPEWSCSVNSLLLEETQGHGAVDPSWARRYPFEGELASTTLWPEIEKIFGHGYEARPRSILALR